MLAAALCQLDYHGRILLEVTTLLYMAARQQDWTSPFLFCLAFVRDREKILRCACTASGSER